MWTRKKWKSKKVKLKVKLENVSLDKNAKLEMDVQRVSQKFVGTEMISKSYQSLEKKKKKKKGNAKLENGDKKSAFSRIAHAPNDRDNLTVSKRTFPYSFVQYYISMYTLAKFTIPDQLKCYKKK